MNRHQTQRGDTIIEVMFAFAVFAMVAVGSIAIMNQGVAATQHSLEITLVREQIDAQADALRYIHGAYVTDYVRGQAASKYDGVAARWVKLTGFAKSSASRFGLINGECPQQAPSGSFILNTHLAGLYQPSQPPAMTPRTGWTVPPFAGVFYKDTTNTVDHTFGIWDEAVRGSSGGSKFIDFHIRACWDSPGSTAPTTLGTIVRLYVPQ